LTKLCVYFTESHTVWEILTSYIKKPPSFTSAPPIISRSSHFCITGFWRKSSITFYGDLKLINCLSPYGSPSDPRVRDYPPLTFKYFTNTSFCLIVLSRSLLHSFKTYRIHSVEEKKSLNNHQFSLACRNFVTFCRKLVTFNTIEGTYKLQLAILHP
jgi:hypothetical protein